MKKSVFGPPIPQTQLVPAVFFFKTLLTSYSFIKVKNRPGSRRLSGCFARKTAKNHVFSVFSHLKNCLGRFFYFQSTQLSRLYPWTIIEMIFIPFPRILKFCMVYTLITPEQKRKTELKRRVVATCIWFLTALMLAIFIPNITDVISVIGSLAAFFILIFPGLIIMQLIVDDRINWHKR